MQIFTISDIENLTGIKAHTLRIWEQRYDFFQPKRKDSKHRIYDNEDLKRLLRVAYLYHQGWKISKIATLSDEDIIQIVTQSPAGPSDYASHITQLLNAMLGFNEYAFKQALNEVIEKVGFENTLIHVCYPYLTRIGNLWATNHALPAQEHFSSYLIQNRVIVETERLGVNEQSPEIILLCPQGEFHELSLLFIQYMLRKNGWSTLYLGTNVTLTELAQIADKCGSKYIYLHLTTNFTGFEVDDYLEKICRQFPKQSILVSGGGAQKAQRQFVNVRLLRTDAAIYSFIKRQPFT
jgi:DNA-binding transcriptional MerR regulator